MVLVSFVWLPHLLHPGEILGSHGGEYEDNSVLEPSPCTPPDVSEVRTASRASKLGSALCDLFPHLYPVLHTRLAHRPDDGGSTHLWDVRELHSTVSRHAAVFTFWSSSLWNTENWKRCVSISLNSDCIRATGDRIPTMARYLSSAQRPDRLWGPPSLLYNGYRGFFPGVRARPERDADHSPH
jgi:hypothetical protein